MMSEDEVSQLTIAEAAKWKCILLRNNNGALKGARGVPVRFGLGNISKKVNEVFKSSDYIGPTTITVTQEMVGKQIAIFTACEMKEEAWVFNPKDEREVAQKNFIDFVNLKGGIAFFADSVDSFRSNMMESLNRFLMK